MPGIPPICPVVIGPTHQTTDMANMEESPEPRVFRLNVQFVMYSLFSGPSESSSLPKSLHAEPQGG